MHTPGVGQPAVVAKATWARYKYSLCDFYGRPLSILLARGFPKAQLLENHSLDCLAGGSVCIDRALLPRIAPSVCLPGLHARRLPLGARRKSLLQLARVHLQPAGSGIFRPVSLSAPFTSVRRLVASQCCRVTRGFDRHSKDRPLFWYPPGKLRDSLPSVAALYPWQPGRGPGKPFRHGIPDARGRRGICRALEHRGLLRCRSDVF